MPKWDDEREDDTDLYNIPGLLETPVVIALRERLSQYDWVAVKHSYGSAEDLPRMLLGLLSTDRYEVGRALTGMFFSVCHQGSVSQASAPAATFLIEILPLADPGLWGYLFELQAGLAASDWRIARHWRSLRYNSVMPTGQQYERRSTEELLRTGDGYSKPESIQDAHLAAAAGYETYLTVLLQAAADEAEQADDEVDDEETDEETDDNGVEDPDTIAMALYLLAGIPEHAARIIPTVEQVFDTSQDLTRQATALMTLSALLDDNAPGWDRFVTLLAAPTTEVSPLLRFLAALSLARDQPARVNDAVIETLVETLVGMEPVHDTVNSAYYRLPWTDRGTFSPALQALGQLGAPMGLRGLLMAARRCVGRPRGSLTIAEAALDAAFFGNAVTDRYWMTPDAQRPRDEPTSTVELPSGQAGDGASRGQPDVRVCYGYDKGAAQALAERFAREGAAALTDVQREALTTLLGCDTLWTIRHNLMALYGLPVDRAVVVAFLAGETP